jgi:hypothetical protein
MWQAMVSDQMATFHLARVSRLMAEGEPDAQRRIALLHSAADAYRALCAERIAASLMVACVQQIADIEV